MRTFAAVLALTLLASCGTPFGIYHEVQPGQTVYRIAYTYGVDMEKMIRLNRIDDPGAIQPGDRLFVPGADRPREVPTTAAAGEPAPTTRSSAKPASKSPQPREANRTETASLRRSTPAPSPSSPPSGGKGAPPPLRWPVDGQVSDPFGRRSGREHDGIDIRAPLGTAIHSAADGRVIYSGDELKGYGNLVIVRHEGCWATVYAHNEKNLVAKGDFVTQGQVIARVGNTGRTSGPHLHFELRCGKVPRDPTPPLEPRTARN
ncbi:MAG: M23 family metallopeptidase [Pararhodobacter sp.]|nr:M23 family metallopeptidase [Pararhodobacter sp.]